jgi:type IV pilus assembly protein PilQ
MNQFLRAAVTLLFLSAGFQASSALASPNSIRKVQTRAEGSALIVQIEMESDVSANPGTWSIVEPPRIVLDFPETTNKTGSNTESVAMGDIKSLNIVQTDQLTRLVLNLYRTAQYSIDSKGRNVVVRIEPRSSVANTDGSVAAPSRLKVVDATKPQSVLSTQNASVRDIRFQRGEEGQGLLLIGLSDGTVPVDVRREGNLLTVEMPGTELPQRLKARRDVNDFATPVTFVTAKTVGAVARFELAARGKWFHQSRVTNNELAIEIRQIPPDDANKLVQAGQQGQKVSINFFEAEATMVLRTLAEISGKNVMIDPSLAGRRITLHWIIFPTIKPSKL